MLVKFSVFFFYSTLLLATFFLYQIRYTLDLALVDWAFPQYALIFLLSMFFILCALKYFHYQTTLKEVSEQDKVNSTEWNQAKEKILSMDPHDIGEILRKMFHTNGVTKVYSTPKKNHPFYDIEMQLGEGTVIVSCLLKDQNQDIPQAYLDRLYSIMRNNEIENGAFITLGDFSHECYEFSKDKPIHLINGEDLINSISL